MISGDSGEYEMLTEAVELSKDVEGMCCEIGLRKGMGTKTIIDAVAEYCYPKFVIAVDPYGSLLYEAKENTEPCRLDYTNDMMCDCLGELYPYSKLKRVNFQHIKLTDIHFFECCAHGVYVYELEAKLLNKYSMVHFDGPHTAESVLAEVKWFHPRTELGATFVFDDIGVEDYFYDHYKVHDWLVNNGWNHIKTGVKKALYQKL